MSNIFQIFYIGRNFTCLFLLLLLIIGSCRNTSSSSNKSTLEYDLIQDPYGFSPLTAAVEFRGINEKLYAKVIVHGKNNGGVSIFRNSQIEQKNDKVVLPILGLYPNYTNQVDVLLTNGKQELIDSLHFEIKTPRLPSLFEKPILTTGKLGANELIFATVYTTKMEDGQDMNFSSKIVGIDEKGAIRWYGNFKERNHIVNEVIDEYIYAGSNKGDFVGKLVKYNFLGEELDVYDFSKNGIYRNIHHDIRQSPNGSFLLTVNKAKSSSTENYILEYNPNLIGNNVQLELDIEEVLPNVNDYFIDLPSSYYADKENILHINGVYPYPDGDHILISSKNAGLAKLSTLSGELKWYLFPHAIKAKAGTSVTKEVEMKRYLKEQYRNYLKSPNTNKRPPASGIFPAQDYTGFVFDYSVFLLNPLDKEGKLLKDDDVVIYGEQSPDFSYPYRQHAPILLRNGNIALFDNGDANRNKNKFSRAVEYVVKEDKGGYGGTVQQVWEYILPSKELAVTVGDIRELKSGNRLINFGSINFPIKEELVNSKAIIVEVTPSVPSKEVFRLDLELPKKSVIYRANKIQLSLIK